MKCINCGTDNKLKDRIANEGRCQQCQHRFTFEPTTMVAFKITDQFFSKIITNISGNTSLFYTLKQLFYFLDRNLKAKSNKGVSSIIVGCLGCSIFLLPLIGIIFQITSLTGYLMIFLIYQAIGIYSLFTGTNNKKDNLTKRIAHAKALIIIGNFTLIAGIAFSIFINYFPTFVMSVVVGITGIYLGIRQWKITKKLPQEFIISNSDLEQWITKWQEINGCMTKMLPPPQQEALPSMVNPDVTAYSFDRLVVCDKSDIAQLLIANNFHFEHNCAILSINGYPQSIFTTIMDMLRRNSELKVYAFHDCSPSGMKLVNHLKTSPEWFQQTNSTIIDIGLLPRHVLASKRQIFVQSTPESAQEAQELPTEVCRTLTGEELAWLDAGNFVELESFTPQKLINILQRSIAGSRDLEGDDSSLVVVDDLGSSGIYIIENFG